jgi:hypothetical protein
MRKDGPVAPFVTQLGKRRQISVQIRKQRTHDYRKQYTVCECSMMRIEASRQKPAYRNVYIGGIREQKKDENFFTGCCFRFFDRAGRQ